MWQMAFVSTCTAVLAVVGFYMGSTIHGPSAAALLPTLAGGAGGFGGSAARASMSCGGGGQRPNRASVPRRVPPDRRQPDRAAGRPRWAGGPSQARRTKRCT